MRKTIDRNLKVQSMLGGQTESPGRVHRWSGTLTGGRVVSLRSEGPDPQFYLLILESEGLPLPVELRKRTLLSILGRGRSELIGQLVQWAESRGIEVDRRCELLEPPYPVRRCRLLTRSEVNRASSSHILTYDLEVDPPGTTLVREFTDHSAQRLKQVVVDYLRIKGVQATDWPAFASM